MSGDLDQLSIRGAVDEEVRPQDDLFGHVNNHWLRSVEIPADRGRYGVFDVLRERAERDVRVLIDEVAASVESGEADDPVSAKVGASTAPSWTRPVPTSWASSRSATCSPPSTR
ncbi:hypothetical protein [Janibacter indicus]|uniref:hypothetical protein n=1 Tax=Janibacter indicus TaxID=857417 RepID=UPI003D9AAEAC